MAATWTTAERTATWAVPPVIGDGSNAQGGDPPALAYEPAAIDENGNYTRSQWITNTSIDRIDAGEAKFRITCNHAYFASVDPLLAPGEAHAHASHSHTFIGNIGLLENLGLEGLASADYASLRNNPKATCSGGPLNATLYWEPTLFYEHPNGIDRMVKPNIVSFYYTLDYADVDETYRLLRGLTFIGGVDPNDRLNTARLAEIPDGAGWDKTQRYNGWVGWVAFDPVTGAIPLAVGNTADANGSLYARQLVNNDGTDPWGGAAEDPDVVLIAYMIAPACWDGHNLRSPNGRDHFRYPIRKSDNSYINVGPQGWWKVPHFEVKSEFANGHVDGLVGHAYRSKLYLSSDRYGREEVDWHPRGSTFHFDWMNGWDSEIQFTWQRDCTGTTQGATAGAPLTCGNSTISATQRLLVGEASPDPTLSNDPVITFHDYSQGAFKDVYAPLPSGTVAPGGTTT